jgi:hypothetical protein
MVEYISYLFLQAFGIVPHEPLVDQEHEHMFKRKEKCVSQLFSTVTKYLRQLTYK